MKRFLLLLTVVCASFATGFSQLPNGTPAPGFNLQDLNGNFHDLYGDYLNQGVHVVIDFSATWCGPCWSYHNSNTLKNFYNAYGPNGTGDAMVFFIEGDLNTNEACLYGPTGCSGGTQGNWVSGTPYPIINTTSTNGPSTASQWSIAFWPTVYMVSAQNGRVYREGTPSATALNQWVLGSFEMEATADITDAVCGGDGEINLNVTAGYGAKTYAWSNGRTTEDLNSLEPGVYICTITDAHSYSVVTDPFVVGGTLAGLEVQAVATQQPSCFGSTNGAAAANGFFGNGSYTYAWSNGQTTSTITGLAAGEYFVTVTDAQGCTTDASVQLTEPDAMQASAVAPEIPCNQTTGTATINATGGTAPYTYNLGSGAQTSNVFPNLAPNTYNYTVLDSKGCNFANSFTLTAQVAPTAAAAAQGNITCAATQVQVSGTGSSSGNNISYAWSTTNGTIVSGQNEAVATVGAAGTYTLQVTNTTNGCSAAASTTVSANTTPPVATVNNGQLTCAITSVQLCVDSDPANTVVWTIGGQNITASCTTVNAAGSYQAQVTGTNGCTTGVTSTVTASGDVPVIAVQTPASLTCATTEVTLQGSVSGNQGDFTIQWSTSNGNIVSGGSSLNPVVNQAGSYTMTATNNSNGCTSSTQVSVSEVPNTLAMQDVSIVNDANNQNLGAVNLNVTGGTTPLTFLWSNGQTSQNLSGIGAGTYSCVVTDGNGCTKAFGPFEVANVSGANDLAYISQFGVYPNPAKQLVNIDIRLVNQGNVKVSLVNSLGAQMMSKTYTGNVADQIDLTTFPSGVYQVVLEGAGFVSSRKVVVLK
jgi:hypothetical protein